MVISTLVMVSVAVGGVTHELVNRRRMKKRRYQNQEKNQKIKLYLLMPGNLWMIRRVPWLPVTSW